MTDWKKRRSGTLRLSASQIETFRLCPRKWWLSKVRKLKEGGPTEAQAFGTVLHAVCERYLRADDNGVDPKTGEAVDLFPTGWHVAFNRYGGIDGHLTVEEQKLVKALIHKAIEEGVLQREPGRQVEAEFKAEIIPGATIEGFVDLLYPHRIEDHKTSKSTKWLKSANALAENPQMLIYAYMGLSESDLPEITLRHNGYVKDPERPIVRKTEITVSREHVEAFWRNEIVPTAEAMLRFRAEAENVDDVDPPESMAHACSAYGGCAFRPICSYRETEDQYELRVSGKKIVDNKGDDDYSESKEATEMSMKDLLVKRAGESPAKTEPAKAEPAKAEPAVDGKQIPPWVDPQNIYAANPTGFDKDGNPCKITAVRAKKAGLPTPDMFDIETTGDGTVLWVGKEGTPAEGLSGESWLRPQSEVAVEAQERVKAPEPEPESESESVAEESEPEDEDGDDESEDEGITLSKDPTKPKPGRPKKGFILLINAPIVNVGIGREARRAISLHHVLDNLYDMMVADLGVEHYTDIDVFQRRDLITKAAPELVKPFGVATVWCDGVGYGASDMKTLVEALIPLAGQVAGRMG